MWKTYIAGREKPLEGFEPLGHRWVNFTQDQKTVVQRTATGYQISGIATQVPLLATAKSLAEQRGWHQGEQ